MEKKKVLITVLCSLLVIFGFWFFRFKFNFKGNDSNNHSSGVKSTEKNKVKTVVSSVNKLTLEEYKNDVFSMKKPKGWKVESAGSGVYYAIRVYDESDERNQVFLMLKDQPFLKNEEARSFWTMASGGNPNYKMFTDAVVLDNPTTEGFYKKFNEIANYTKTYAAMPNFNFPTISNFNKLEEFSSDASMKSVSLDSKVLRATFNDQNNKEAEGLFMASIVNFGDSFANGIDFSYYMVYDIVSVTSVKDQFIDYKDILLQVVNSINFSDEYVKKTIDESNAQTKKSLEINASIQKSFDSYMSAWENRSKTYDIMSQKQSDATLGYERVYDTETGDIYKAYNGFGDDYDGNRYKNVTDDMYTEKVYGYIEK